MTGDNGQLSRFGFSFKRGGAHTSRTMMLEELGTLLTHVNQPKAGKTDYRRAIVDQNCLGKRSGKTRVLTYGHLVDLYSLDPSIAIFRTLLYFWHRDTEGQPLLALLCACARDSVFRSTAPFMLNFPEGATVSRESLEAFIDEIEPDRFSKATLKSTAQNINSTWGKSGHLIGRANKRRARPRPTAGSLAYALYLGYLMGARGQGLFQTEYAKLLDCPLNGTIDLAGEASRKGWIASNRIGELIDIRFPNLITPEEAEWLRGQN